MSALVIMIPHGHDLGRNKFLQEIDSDIVAVTWDL